MSQTALASIFFCLAKGGSYHGEEEKIMIDFKNFQSKSILG